MTKKDVVIAGIDLAGTPSNPSGWATLKNREVSARHLFSNKEIIKEIRDCNPTLTALDAPLNLPKSKELTRKADRGMQKRGYQVFPPRFRTMKKLTLRAIKLTQQIKREGFAVIEVHPTAALTGCLHLKQKTELIGDIREGYIVVPIKNDWRRLKQ